MYVLDLPYLSYKKKKKKKKTKIENVLNCTNNQTGTINLPSRIN